MLARREAHQHALDRGWGGGGELRRVDAYRGQLGSGSAAATAAKTVDVPTEQDFEQQAAASVDDKNVEAKVQAIEKDLGQ